MGNYKLPMELIADKKARYRTFGTREKGLRKKLSELCTLCGIQGCMIVYGPNGDGDGICSSQPRVWPENRGQVECLIKEYMEKRKEEPGKRSTNLSDVLEIGNKNRGELKKPRPMLPDDQFSYEQLTEIIAKLDEKIEEVDNLIALKKEETAWTNEVSVHCPISSTIQSLDSDQGTRTGTVGDDLDSKIHSLLTMEEDDFDIMMNLMGATDDRAPEFYDFSTLYFSSYPCN